MYASERMTQLLGLLQVSVIGAHFHEVVNVEDQDDFSLLLNDKTVWSRLIVMKCGSPSRGKHKSKVIHVSVLRRCDKQEFPFVVLECEPFARVPILELVIGASMEFTVNAYTRIVLDTDWKFELLSGFGRKQFIGTNMMQYVYPTDVEVSRDMHMQVVHSVINKGVYHQLPYRVLSGHGVWYWNTMEIRPSKVRNGKVIEMKCRIIILRPYIPEEGVYYSRKSTAPSPPTLTRKDITLPLRSASNVSVDYSSLHSLSDLPTSNPPSVCSSSGCSSGEVSCSTEPLSDLSVEDVLGPPNDTSNDSSSHFQQVQHGQFLSNPPPSLPYESNVTGDIMELLLH